MRTIKLSRGIYVGLLGVFFAIGCDSTSEPAPLPGPIIVITNTWVEESNLQHAFGLESDDDGESEGTFVGEEETPQGDLHPLTGHWGDGAIQFTVERDGTATTYEATFTEENPDRLVFTAGEGDLVLVREASLQQ